MSPTSSVSQLGLSRLLRGRTLALHHTYDAFQHWVSERSTSLYVICSKGTTHSAGPITVKFRPSMLTRVGIVNPWVYLARVIASQRHERPISSSLCFAALSFEASVLPSASGRLCSLPSLGLRSTDANVISSTHKQMPQMHSSRCVLR